MVNRGPKRKDRLPSAARIEVAREAGVVILAHGEPAVGPDTGGGQLSPGRGDIRRGARGIEQDGEEPIDAGKPRMPPQPGLTDFLPYSHPTAGAVGYRMPPAWRAYSPFHH